MIGHMAHYRKNPEVALINSLRVLWPKKYELEDASPMKQQLPDIHLFAAIYLECRRDTMLYR